MKTLPKNVRTADPQKVKRCYYCGAKKTEHKGAPVIFHKPGCKLNETKDQATGKYLAEEQYPGIEHGGYISADVFGV